MSRSVARPRRWRVAPKVAGIAAGAVIVGGMLVPSVALAVEVPTVTSANPNAAGSGGNTLVELKGTHFEGVETNGVKFGAEPGLKKTTSTPKSGEFEVVSTTSIMLRTRIHERGTVNVTVTNAAGQSPATAANEFTFVPEVYRNESPVGTARIPVVGYGQLTFEAPQFFETISCVNFADGIGWNEGTPTQGRGELIAWYATSHFPEAEHPELANTCTLTVNGNHFEPELWLTTEAPLRRQTQEGEICRNPEIKELKNCPNEREKTTVITEVFRGHLETPWNIQFTEKEGKPRVRIGLPDECKNKTGAERTEINNCPEQSERIPGNPERCQTVHPSPEGCVKLNVVDAGLNIETEYEGYVEPRATNGVGNALSPSSWEFQGHAHGEPSLHAAETPEAELTATGFVKMLGFNGQELMTVK
jgi:hypothetical protein